MTDKKVSDFRSWVHNLWVENWEERLTYGETPVNIQQYWKEYKFWLKREFRHQQQKEKQQQKYADRFKGYSLGSPRSTI